MTITAAAAAVADRPLVHRGLAFWGTIESGRSVTLRLVFFFAKFTLMYPLYVGLSLTTTVGTIFCLNFQHKYLGTIDFEFQGAGAQIFARTTTTQRPCARKEHGLAVVNESRFSFPVFVRAR